ncbi:Major facilitator superfamily domain, general substrate transporter [Lasallia pustulata]|uniref:Major facilitator superfamily domain, general substrate transporter n=1 Tax=Lasallia pustulata TaxID=136370 RepID=A0A1W5DAT3_9LECA|nr:Major facilitator superfamily domain, general substrate transporter [Lasallia pustulata]
MMYSHEPLQEGHALSIELHLSQQHKIAQGKDTSTTSVEEGPRQSSNPGITGAAIDHQSPTTCVGRQERWNHPRINIARLFAAFYGFVIMGLNDAAYGALIPYLEIYYNLSYTVISLIFLSPLVGYAASAPLNNVIHMRLGRRGVAFLGPGTRAIAYIVICLHPRYPVMVVFFILAGFGNGLEDAAWNAWIGNMEKANEVLGILHGFYGLGATLSPLIATTMVTKAKLPWYTFYYIMIGVAVTELVAGTTAFWTSTGPAYREANPRTAEETGNRMKEALHNRVTWVCSVFFLVCVGIEVAISGWVVVFMMKVRHAAPFAAGMGETGYWLGLTVGRVILGFVTGRLGEMTTIVAYMAIATALQLIFWLVPNFYVSAVAVSFLGFFIGPLFPAAIVASTKRLPQHLHVASIGFAAASGAGGACVLPFAVGAIAQAKGVQVLMPIVLAMLVANVGVWMWLLKV